MKRRSSCLILLAAAAAWAQIELATVTAKPVARTIDLPGEIQPYLSVSIRAKVPGFVERILVDRGSVVKEGDLLVELSAPEMTAQIAEIEAKVQAAEADRLQAEAQVAAAQSTYDRLKKAAETPGVVAGNDVIQAQKQVEAAQAVVRSREQAVHALQATVQTQKDLLAYLKITAPFDGIVTERFVHPGAFAGPSGNEAGLVTLQQVSRLRLIVPVPEEDVGTMLKGALVMFRVPAYPERTYAGAIARVSHALDPKTRTEPVELDVINRDGTLAPGMFPTVAWPVHSSHPGLFVPRTAVVTTTERTFVIRDRSGSAEWVDVRKGPAESDLIQVTGALQAGDKVVKRGTDEIRPGTPLGKK
jgi:membrane fusion protein, multidrug efflux system